MTDKVTGMGRPTKRQEFEKKILQMKEDALTKMLARANEMLESPIPKQTSEARQLLESARILEREIQELENPKEEKPVDERKPIRKADKMKYGVSSIFEPIEDDFFEQRQEKPKPEPKKADLSESELFRQRGKSRIFKNDLQKEIEKELAEEKSDVVQDEPEEEEKPRRIRRRRKKV